jgi:hypothetical protein
VYCQTFHSAGYWCGQGNPYHTYYSNDVNTDARGTGDTCERMVAQSDGHIRGSGPHCAFTYSLDWCYSGPGGTAGTYKPEGTQYISASAYIVGNSYFGTGTPVDDFCA